MTGELVYHTKSPARLVHGLVCATGILLLVGAVVTVSPRPANALPKYTAQTGIACGRCHVNPAGGGPRTGFGKAFVANGHKVPSKKVPSKKVPSKTESHIAPAKPGNQATSSEPQVLAAQKPDQWLASNFKGSDVFGADGKKIGSVADILFETSGKIDAYVVSVDGASGMDAKTVAIAPSAFQVVTGKKGEPGTLKLNMDGKQLKQAPSFAASKP